MTLMRTAHIGSYNATMMLSDAGDFRVSWSPRAPNRLSGDELAIYLDIRNAMVSDMLAGFARNRATLKPYAKASWSDVRL